MATQIYLGLPPPNVVKWIKENYKPDMTKVPLTFTAEEPGAKLSFKSGGTYDPQGNPIINDSDVTLETSTTGEEGSWQPYNVGDEITLANVGDKVMFRNSSDEIQVMSSSGSKYTQFDINSGKIAASGNIMFLMDKTGELRDLSDKNWCFAKMFFECMSLTQAPELPATTLANDCYYRMFNGCTSLTQAPELPATTLAENCYADMFANCSSLTQAPELPATNLAKNCYYEMFYYCTSLTQAPELPATDLVEGCYKQMFYQCNKLNSINVNFTIWSAGYKGATPYWVYQVASSGTFTCPADLPEEFEESKIPTGWTVVRK